MNAQNRKTDQPDTHGNLHIPADQTLTHLRERAHKLTPAKSPPTFPLALPPRLAILDEASSALDLANERLLYSALRQVHMQYCTINLCTYIYIYS